MGNDHTPLKELLPEGCGKFVGSDFRARSSRIAVGVVHYDLSKNDIEISASVYEVFDGVFIEEAVSAVEKPDEFPASEIDPLVHGIVYSLVRFGDPVYPRF